MKIRLFITVILSTMLLQACVFSIDDGDIRRSPTIGQELIDLERAYETNVISDEEFDSLKEKILNKRR